MKKERKDKIFQIFTYFCLALSLVSTITYMIYTILNSNNILSQIVSIISVIILAIFSILYVIVGMFAKSKKVMIFLVIGSLLLSFYSIFQVIVDITTPSDLVLDFTGKDIKKVVTWAEDRNIFVEQEFRNSDTIPKYKIISQNIKAGTSTKNLNKMLVIVSDGIDTSVSTEVTNMVGWNLDDVITFIDNNHLTNVTIEFEFSNTVEKDKIISQNVIREIKRNEPVTLVSSLGREENLKSVTMDNLVGLDTFHALIYLGRNHLNYSIEYAYNDEKDEGIVLKQSIKKWKVINPNDDEKIIITICKKDKITVPDLSKMNITEINKWATENRLKIEVKEEYDDTIKLGKVVGYSPSKGNMIDINSTVYIVISKGQLRMIKFSDIDSFKTWALENGVLYTVDYQFSNTVEKGKLVSSSHKENQIIKNNDTIKLIISQGSNTIIPNLIGMTEEEANNSCSKANINCKYVYLDDNNDYTIITKQSIKSGINVPANTTVTLTLGK